MNALQRFGLNGKNLLEFFKNMLVGNARDVSMNWYNTDDSVTTYTYPNFPKQIETLTEIINNTKDSMFNDNSTMPYEVTFEVGGDHDKYYPVFFIPSDDSSGINNYLIYRQYYEKAPKEWNNSTSHKGALALYFQATDTQWDAGFYNYVKLTHAKEVYQRIYADAFVVSSGGYGPICVYLRGGGATYHLRSSDRVRGVEHISWDKIPPNAGAGSRYIGGTNNIIIMDKNPPSDKKQRVIIETYGQNSNDSSKARDYRTIPRAWYSKDEIYDDNLAPKPLLAHRVVSIDDKKIIEEYPTRIGYRFSI